MDYLAFLLSIAAALPGVHSPLVATLPGGPPGFREPSIAIEQERPGELGKEQIQRRKDEQLVPQDVSAVGFAVPSARGDADIEVDHMQRHGLQQVKEVQAQEELGAPAILESDVAFRPETSPGQEMGLQQFSNPARTLHSLAGRDTAFRNGVIPGGVEGDDFLNGDRLASRQIEFELLSDAPLLLDGVSSHVEPLSSTEHLCSRGFGDLQMRLIRLDQEVETIFIHAAAPQRLEMPAVELVVAFDPGVDHVAIKSRPDQDAPRPVLPCDGHFDGRQMLISHMDQAPTGEGGLSALIVAKPQRSAEHPLFEVQRLPI